MKHLLVMLLFACSLGAQTKETIADSRLRFAPTVGFAYRTAPLSDQLTGDDREYVQKMKPGYNIGAELSYSIKPQWGIGAKFNQFNSIYTTYLNGINPDGSASRENIKDKIKISFIGPTYFSRVLLPNARHSVSGSLGLGYLAYRNSANFRGDSIKIKGGTFGSAMDLGYDYRLSKSLYAGVQLGYTVGVLNKISIKENATTTEIELEGDTRENLSFLNIGGGLRLSI